MKDGRRGTFRYGKLAEGRMERERWTDDVSGAGESLTTVVCRTPRTGRERKAEVRSEKQIEILKDVETFKRQKYTQ